MLCSRRTNLAEPHKRGSVSRTIPGKGSRLAAAALLVLGGVAALLLAARLVAALAGWEIAGLSSLSAIEGEFLAAAVLFILIIVLAALISMIPAQEQRSLWLGGEHGGVLVPLAALQRLAEAEALRHPDVVRAEARLRERDGAPAGRLTVYARPLADVTRVSGDVQARVRAELDHAIGRDTTAVDVRTTVLRVNQLTRYLP